MEQILNTIGIDTELLNKELLHNREDTMKILGVSHTTLKKYEDENLIRPSRFKRKKYYTKESILMCIKQNLKLNSRNPEWNNIWD